MTSEIDRYARQIALPSIGAEGQRLLAAGHVLVVGCGALGSGVVELLARAGVGTITVVDRDVVEPSNLQRQFLFDEEDARRATPKVEAAKARVARINSQIRVRAFHDDFGRRNARRYAEGVDVFVDGLDNLETRYLLNDLAVSEGRPYVYGAAVATRGMLAVVRPGVTPCLRCLAPELPAPGAIETCETAGVLGTATAVVASLEATEAIKLLVRAEAAVERSLVHIDVWSCDLRRIDLLAGRDPACVCCGRRQFDFLDGDALPRVQAFCGRDTVQIVPATPLAIDLDLVAARLGRAGPTAQTTEVVRTELAAEGVAIEVFLDGRVLVRGTSDPERARSLAARFVGL